MYRLVELSRAIRDAVPPELAPVFWVVTATGSPTILLGALWVAYWNWDDHRREMLTVVGVAFVALALTLTLKEWFGLPRPPVDVRNYPIVPSGYGFPSGHAISSSVVYGGALLATGYYRRRLVAAATVSWVALIGLSRVILGVHFLGDIVIGFALGIAVLGLLVLILDHYPARLFVIAAALAAVAFALAGGDPDPDIVLALGGSLGSLGALVWLTDDARKRRFRASHERLWYTAAGLVIAGAALGLTELSAVPWPLLLVIYTALGFGVIVLPTIPHLVERLSPSPESA